MSPRDVVFVAHHVGGGGGMERQAERLVDGLLDAGVSVTVIARSCSLHPRPGLTFVRVRVPRRPAAIAFPAFFAVASVLVARRRGGALLHTTGALVGNRADVATVHYCHRAAGPKVEGSRASRPSPAYRLNSAVDGVLARTAERWCYRPSRTRLLCAVSQGVAAELRAGFPRAARTVRTVPNGVDSRQFRPDRQAREEVRLELGLTDDVPLALFVGGDWARKGLRHVVDALGQAPAWHLAVAGAGDRQELRARARARGAEDRLQLLGVVHDMPRLYAAADAFVFPTAYEAFPLVALEAAASGLPLLVTRVNGVEDLLRDGVNGWFVDADAADIARRLTQLGADRPLAERLSAAARAAASVFSWEAMTDGYLGLYAELGQAAAPAARAARSGLRVERLAGHSFLSAPLSRESVVIDLGVNEGAFAHAIIRDYGCRVVGVEPVPELFETVPADDRLIVERLAVTGDGGPATLYVNQSTCATIQASLAQHEAPAQRVAGTTLEGLLDRHGVERAALVKVDIESAELELLECSSPETLRRADQFTIEFHDFLDPELAAPTERAKQRLRAAGFSELALSRDNTDVLFVNAARLPFGRARRTAVAVSHKYPRGMARLLRRSLGRERT